jgi:hypothetical protein
MYAILICPIRAIFLVHFIHLRLIGEGKVIPLHAMEAHGGRGGIAPTHS